MRHPTMAEVAADYKGWPLEKAEARLDRLGEEFCKGLLLDPHFLLAKANLRLRWLHTDLSRKGYFVFTDGDVTGWNSYVSC